MMDALKPQFYYTDLPSHHGSQTAMSSRRRLRRPSSLLLIVVVVLIMGVAMMGVNLYQLQQMREEHSNHHKDQMSQMSVVEGTVGKGTHSAPVVWIHAKRIETGYLKHVQAVFDRLGFSQSSGDDDWDVLWAHDYPFNTLSNIMKRLQPHQKVNHFPGSGYITSKVSLMTSASKFMPPAFKLPKEKDKFTQFAKKFPEKLWVQKNNNHRGVKIKHLHELTLDANDTFMQEYVANPLLIDGRKFDIGVYAVMTSLHPLRVYIVKDDALFRFCPKEYYPFDAGDVNKYVVGDNYMPVWEMPSLKQMYSVNRYSFKETLNRYLISQGKNVIQLWENIEESIRTVYLEKQSSLSIAAAKYKSTRHFFELVRFDFVLDEDINVYLMEVNMSPNLSTSHFSGNRQLYEHIVFNVLRVAGVASMVTEHFHKMDNAKEEMLVSDKEIAVFSDWCTEPVCNRNCADQRCILCHKCMDASNRQVYKDAYLEHTNRGSCGRVFPPPISRVDALKWTPENDTYKLITYTEENKNVFVWFIGMCRKDETFCV